MRKTMIFGAPCSAWVCAAQAQNFPSKPLRLIVAFPAGGPIDFAARVLSPKMSELLGQQVIVDNRAGANGKHL